MKLFSLIILVYFSFYNYAVYLVRNQHFPKPDFLFLRGKTFDFVKKHTWKVFQKGSLLCCIWCILKTNLPLHHFLGDCQIFLYGFYIFSHPYQVSPKHPLKIISLEIPEVSLFHLWFPELKLNNSLRDTAKPFTDECILI